MKSIVNIYNEKIKGIVEMCTAFPVYDNESFVVGKIKNVLISDE